MFNRDKISFRLLVLCLFLMGPMQASHQQNMYTGVKGFASRHPVATFMAGALAAVGIWQLGKVTAQWAKRAKPIQALKGKKLPIVYSPGYDITLGGLEKLHDFDGKKYGKVRRHLVDNLGIPRSCMYEPEEVAESDLLKVHCSEYLESLSMNSHGTLRGIIGLSVINKVPAWMMRWRVLRPMKLATSGTIQAVDLALKDKWAINLSGGYHHAKGNKAPKEGKVVREGEGFCVYGDIQLAILKAREKNPNLKTLIVDLDAHRGNGHETFFHNDENVCIFDMYGMPNYPGQKGADESIHYDFELNMSNRNHLANNFIVIEDDAIEVKGVEDKEYLKILRDNLPKAIATFKPDLILYNAGTDIYEKDPLGHLDITMQGIIDRDEFVFSQARDKNIPIAMVLSGGYTKESSTIISKSIENLLKKVLKVIPQG
jgi:histone deacetylase 11